MRSTIALVIKKQNRGEYDQQVTLLTKKYGKSDFVCRGVRKKEAKLAGHLGLLCLSDVGFVLGKRLKVLTSACDREHFPAIKSDLGKFAAAQHIVTLVDGYIIGEERDEDMFNLIVGALDYLNRKEMDSRNLKFFLRYFEFKFLSALGYEPEDKTVVRAFHGERAALSERELDEIEHAFHDHFHTIYPLAHHHG